MLQTKVPFYLIFVAGLAGGLVPYLTLRHTLRQQHTASLHTAGTANAETSTGTPVMQSGSQEHQTIGLPGGSGDQLKYSRQKGYELMKPMLLAKKSAESVEYAPLKTKIENLIAEDQQAGLLTSATVYLMRFGEGRWMYVNPELAFHPGSLIKIPMLITYLKEAEENPGVMNQKILFENSSNIPQQTYNSSSIKPGNSYTVKELLHYMIAYSDNNATYLLNEHVDLKTFLRTFTELNISQPDVKDHNYEITARHISKFFIVLYNATYLSRNSSEEALKLLNECNFKDGIQRGVPAHIKIAHKFGEWGDGKNNIHELHETALVYLNNDPYLLTVMTRGSNPKDLSMEIGKISKTVYDVFSKSPDL